MQHLRRQVQPLHRHGCSHGCSHYAHRGAVTVHTWVKSLRTHGALTVQTRVEPLRAATEQTRVQPLSRHKCSH